VRKVVRAAIARVPESRSCPCGSALSTAFVTEKSKIPAATKRSLAAIIGKYIR
jgi:hypothetical protein